MSADGSPKLLPPHVLDFTREHVETPSLLLPHVALPPSPACYLHPHVILFTQTPVFPQLLMAAAQTLHVNVTCPDKNGVFVPVGNNVRLEMVSLLCM